MTDLFDRHRDRLMRAVDACRARGAWSPFVESPSRKNHPEGAHEIGRKSFESTLGSPFEIDSLPAPKIGEEISPYTAEALGIEYPRFDDLELIFDLAERGVSAWISAGVRGRVGVCMQMLERLSEEVFANAYATMHTAGQPFMTAFAGSGANSLDRGLEALAYAYKAMIDVPEHATFERRFGGEPVTLRKRYELRPRGVALVITCASYPAWNAYPAIFANLATGNPVVVKPHPGGTLPMAMAVRTCRAVLAEAGFDPNLLVLACDSAAAPITKALATHRRTAIVDFTGSAEFGAWLESNCRQALVYTETAGCNAVLVESADDFDAVARALANGLCLFSSQMCTAPQNIFVPRSGVRTADGALTADEAVERIVAAIDSAVSSPAWAAAVCGALQSERVLETIDKARAVGSVIRESSPYDHPEFASARTATPLLLREEQPHRASRREWFGPIAFVLPVPDRDAALNLATRDAREHGAIASYLYSTDDDFVGRAEEAFFAAGASLGVNLVAHTPMNYTAGYSDYHVTGLNPAGNASLTDLAFVANRFRIVQSKRETG